MTGLSHMTDYGVLVSFPIFDVRSVAPEVLLQGLPKNTVQGSELQGDEEMGHGEGSYDQFNPNTT